MAGQDAGLGSQAGTQGQHSRPATETSQEVSSTGEAWDGRTQFSALRSCGNFGIRTTMRRFLAMSVLFAAGCSTAPIADFLDFVAPGGPPGGVREPVPVPGPRIPAPPDGRLPPPKERFGAPPLPPVPDGASLNKDWDEEDKRPARLQPKPADF